MRILLIAPQPFYIERGTPIAVRHLAEALGAMGHSVDLLTTHLGEDVDIEGCTIHRATAASRVKSLPIGFSLSKLFVDAAILAKMTTMLRRNSYDVVHAVEESIFLAAPFCGKKRPQLVYDMDSVLSDQLIEKFPHLSIAGKAMQALERKAVQSSDLVLPVCEAIADRAREWTDGPVHVLPDIAPEPSSDPSTVPSIKDRNGRPLALYVGNLDHYQGIDLLLESMQKVPAETRPMLKIIGGNENSITKYKDKAQSLGLEGDVQFLGPRPLTDLMHYLAQADILCSPRIKGVNTPMKVYAYMASGVPVVATNITSHTQVIDNKTAFLGYANPDSYAAALTEALQSSSLRQKVGAASMQLAKQSYGIARFRERLSVAYRQLEQATDEGRNSDEN